MQETAREEAEGVAARHRELLTLKCERMSCEFHVTAGEEQLRPAQLKGPQPEVEVSS